MIGFCSQVLPSPRRLPPGQRHRRRVRAQRGKRPLRPGPRISTDLTKSSPSTWKLPKQTCCACGRHCRSGFMCRRRFDSLVTKNLRDDRLAENAAELDAVVKGDPPESEKSLVLIVFAELDQETPLVLLCWPGGTVALESYRHVFNGNIAPPKRRRHINPLWQCRPHAQGVCFSDFQIDGLDFVKSVEILGPCLSGLFPRCVRILRRCRLPGGNCRGDRKR